MTGLTRDEKIEALEKILEPILRAQWEDSPRNPPLSGLVLAGFLGGVSLRAETCLEELNAQGVDLIEVK